MSGFLSFLGPLVQGVKGAVAGQAGSLLSSKQTATNTEPPPMVEAQTAAPPKRGEASAGFLDKLLEGGKEAALSSILDPLKARADGRATRQYNQSAFPEMNPWETAGLGGSGGQLAGKRSDEQRDKRQFAQQTKLQTQQLGTQEVMQQRELTTRKEVADLQAKTAIANADTTSRAARDRLEREIAVGSIAATADKTRQDTQTSLSQAFVNYARKNSINQDTSARVYKSMAEAFGAYEKDGNSEKLVQRLSVLGVSKSSELVSSFLRRLKGGKIPGVGTKRSPSSPPNAPKTRKISPKADTTRKANRLRNEEVIEPSNQPYDRKYPDHVIKPGQL